MTIEHRSIWSHLRDVPFRQDWIDVAGVRTRYVQAGRPDTPAVIMLHGTAGSWEGFSANLGAHAQHFNTYAIDMIGTGYTDKPDHDYEIATYVDHVRGFMRAVGLQRASLVGCSLGAWICARFALDHPALTERITLLSAAGLFANASNMSRIRNVRSKAVEDPSWANIKPIFDHLLANESSRIPDIIAMRQAVYRLPGMARAMDHILCLQDPEIRPRNLLTDDQWRRIETPALVVGSLADKDEYLETARRVAKLMPNARYVEMPDVGHWPQFEDPDTFNRLNIDFLLDR